MEFSGSVNYFAVVAAAIASFIVGWLWYGPLFGKTWAKEKGMKMDKISEAQKKEMGKLMIWNFVGTLVMVYVLAHFVLNLTSNYSDVFALVFWIWLGFFVATTLLGEVLWSKGTLKLFVINAAYWLVNLLVSAMILFVWR